MEHSDDEDEDLQRILLQTAPGFHNDTFTNSNNEVAVHGGGYLEAQDELFRRFRGDQMQQQQFAQRDESAELAAAIAASEYEQHQRVVREENERKRRREQRQEEERQQQVRSMEFAAQLQRQEMAVADQELATALETSEQEAQTVQGLAASKALEQSVLTLHQTRTLERHVGSWDCQNCTYSNEPFSPKCKMCQRAPSNDVLVFQPIPPKMRFGVEFEMMITDGIRDGFSLEWLATELTRLGPPRVEFRGYSHETSECWKIVTDASVQGQHENDLCFELVSPILVQEEEVDDEGTGEPTGIKALRVVMENVRKLGIATNTSCGFHVHVDATNGPNQAVKALGTLDGVKRVSQCFVALENAFDLLVSHAATRNTNRNKYCQSNRIASGALSNRQRWDRLEQANGYQALVDLINPSRDRYRKLNLTNIIHPSRASTCEFRHHGGVEELCEAEAWVRLLLRFCERAAAVGHTSSVRYLPEAGTPADELRALFDLVACPGLEQFYVFERKLFVPKQQLRHEWECRRCHRRFASSRDLSQHASATGHRQ